MISLFKKSSRQKDFKEIGEFLVNHLKQLHDSKENIPEDVFDVSSFFITESIQLFDSIDILTRKNHFRGCLPLARTLMEISINFQYIYKEDIEQRAKNFKLDSLFEMKRKGDSIADESRNHPQYQYYMDKINAELKDYKREKKSVYEKAKELNMESTYQNAYRRLSEYVHSGYKPPQDFDEEGPYYAFLKRTVFSDTAILILFGLKSMCEKYDLKGGYMVIDKPDYIGTLFLSTNPKREEERGKTEL